MSGYGALISSGMDILNNTANQLFARDAQLTQRAYDVLDWNKNKAEWQRRYDMQRKHSLSDYQMQKQDALEQWNRQNDYDSAQSQMARFKSAGLNPNLVYGQMAHGATMQNVTAPSVPNPSAPPSSHTDVKFHPIDMSTAAAALGSLETKILETEILGSQKQYVNEQVESLRLDNKRKQKDLDEYDAEKERNVQKFYADLRHTIASTNLTESQRDDLLLKIDRGQYEYDEYVANRQYRDRLIAVQANNAEELYEELKRENKRVKQRYLWEQKDHSHDDLRWLWENQERSEAHRLFKANVTSKESLNSFAEMCSQRLFPSDPEKRLMIKTAILNSPDPYSYADDIMPIRILYEVVNSVGNWLNPK